MKEMQLSVTYKFLFGLSAIIGGMAIGWIESSTSEGRIMVRAVLGVIGLLVIVYIAIVCILHNVRILRARRTFKRLPEDVKIGVLEAISKASAQRPSVTYLLPDDGPCNDAELVVSSHLGGTPYLEGGETWPDEDASETAPFLLQVRLVDPSLGDRWQNRLITIFLSDHTEPIIRVYNKPSLDRYSPVQPAAPTLPCVRLRPMTMPAVGEDDLTPMSPTRLCENIPGIRAILSPFSDDVSGLLAQVLHPGVYRYDLEAPEIAYQGGSPTLISEPHAPECEVCQRQMRFLFQFGDIIPGYQLCDAGVGYVYGCDYHPQRCELFIDCH